VASERFLDLAVALQEPYVLSESAGAGANPREHREHSMIHLAWIRLPDDVVRTRETEARRQAGVELVDLLVVAAEELQKAVFRAGRPTGATEPELAEHQVHLLEISKQVQQPQGGALAHRGGLGRLPVGIAERGKRTVPVREVRQGRDRRE